MSKLRFDSGRQTIFTLSCHRNLYMLSLVVACHNVASLALLFHDCVPVHSIYISIDAWIESL